MKLLFPLSLPCTFLICFKTFFSPYINFKIGHFSNIYFLRFNLTRLSFSCVFTHRHASALARIHARKHTRNYTKRLVFNDRVLVLFCFQLNNQKQRANRVPSMYVAHFSITVVMKILCASQPHRARQKEPASVNQAFRSTA